MGILLYATLWFYAQVLMYLGTGAALSAVWSRRRQSSAAFGDLLALGLATQAILGGVLNLCGIASRRTLLGLTLVLGTIGLAKTVYAYIPVRKTGRANTPPIAPGGTRMFTALVIVLTVVRIETCVYSITYNAADDLQAYVAFPQKMLQTGSLGSELYSERRVASGLGGAYYLVALMTAPTFIEASAAVDRGLGFLLLVALILRRDSQHKGGPSPARLLLATATLLVPIPQLNITVNILGAGLLLALFRAIQEMTTTISVATVRRTAVLAAGLASLKSTYFVPALGLATIAPFISFGLPHRPKLPLRLAVAASTVALIAMFLAPWMVVQWRDTLTPLFPLLGKGTHQSAYGHYPMPSTQFRQPGSIRQMMMVFFLLSPLPLMLVAATCAWWWVASMRRTTWIIGGLTLFGGAAVTWGTGGFNVGRYVFPLFFATTAWSILLLADHVGLAARRMAVALAFAFAVYTCGRYSPRLEVTRAATDFAAAWQGRTVVGPEEVASVQAAQAAVPPDETILTRLSNSALVDFRRNRIQTADYPGSASPPPGMPDGTDPAALVAYLRSQRIRYVMYSYRDEANFKRREGDWRLADGQNVWLKSEAVAAYRFQDALATLLISTPIVYRDEQTVVLDLQ